MELWIFISSIFIGIIVCGIFWYLEFSRRQAVITSVRNGQDVIATWYYTSTEWRFANEQYFKIRMRPGDFGKASFTPQYIYVSNGRKDFIFELIGTERYVRHLTEIDLYRKSPMNTIKFQVRTKIVEKDKSGNETSNEKCSLEEFYIPVPNNYEVEINSIIKFYQSILDRNIDAVAAVMPYGLGMFGR